MKKQFCPYCGTKLDAGARFCTNCGEAIYNAPESETPPEHSSTERTTERKTVYEGYIHKCPNCGEVLNSFSAMCPTCGYEIRNRQVASSIQELVGKLELIDAKRMDPLPPEPILGILNTEVSSDESPSAMKKLIGWDFQESKRRESAEQARLAKERERERIRKEHRRNALNAERKFEKQKQFEKINQIQNFPIPNTKEDILEFTLLVSSNIRAKNAAPYAVLKAWMDKLDQVYQKAILSLDEDPDLGKIQEIYQQTSEYWKKKRNWCRIKIVLAVMAKSIIAIAGLFLFIAAIITDKRTDGVPELLELIGAILLVISAVTLSRREASYSEIAITAGCGGLSLLLASQTDNSSLLYLCGVIVLFISAINFIKKLVRKD